MRNSDAVRVVGMMAQVWGKQISDETALLWAGEITEFDVADGIEAVHAMSRSARFMPSLAELLAECRYHRDLRLEQAGHALPAPAPSVDFDDYLATHPDGRERVSDR